MCQSSYEKAECSSSKRVVKFEKPEKPPRMKYCPWLTVQYL